jgi:hypothetical protein
LAYSLNRMRAFVAFNGVKGWNPSLEKDFLGGVGARLGCGRDFLTKTFPLRVLAVRGAHRTSAANLWKLLAVLVTFADCATWFYGTRLTFKRYIWTPNHPSPG